MHCGCYSFILNGVGTEEQMNEPHCIMPGMQTHSLANGDARVNKRRWFGSANYYLFFCGWVGQRGGVPDRQRATTIECMGWPSFVFVFATPRRWLLCDFIHVGCMCCLISIRHGRNAFLQPFHSINSQMMTPKSFFFFLIIFCTKCDFGKCALTIPAPWLSDSVCLRYFVSFDIWTMNVCFQQASPQFQVTSVSTVDCRLPSDWNFGGWMQNFLF